MSQSEAKAVTPPDRTSWAERAWRRVPWNEVAVTVVAIVLALLVGAVLMVVSDPAIAGKWAYFFDRPGDAVGASVDKVMKAYGALLEGSVGGIPQISSTTAQAAPLICAGLGIGLAFRAGLFNIGGQGQAIFGAAAAALVGFSFKGLPLVIHLPFAILFGLVAGGIWGGIVGLLKAKSGAHEVIVTIMMNYIAGGLLAYALTTKLFLRPGRLDPISPIVEWSATFPRIEGTQFHLGFVLALAAAFVVWWIMERTTLGFEIRAVGSSPSASATAGMSVANITIITMALSGALAGLAGVEAALGPMSGATPTPLTAGLVGTIGFDAITVVLLGRSRPLGTVFAGLLFGALHAGGLRMQSMAQTPLDLTMVLQALIVLFVGAPMLVRAIAPFLKVRKAPPTAGAAPTADVGATGIGAVASQGGRSSFMSKQLPRPDGQPPVVPPMPKRASAAADQVSLAASGQDTAPARAQVDTTTVGDQEIHQRHTESREARTQRVSTGVLVGVVAVLMVWLITQTSGIAQFSLSDALAEVKLPTLNVPGVPTVAICALLLVGATAGFLVRGLDKRWRTWAGVVAGLATVIGFLTWAAAGRGLPFQVSNQLAGTLLFATPLILGALCGVMCERAGVVNVAIEGQMLTAAFTAAVVGSVTQSIGAALFAAVLAGVLMGAMLAVFAIKFLMDQVVLGVVINVFASGLTGFLFNQLVQPQSAKLNEAPLMTPIAIPGLSKIPFFGAVLFNQTLLAYLAVISVVVVWFILGHTTWGLRIRSVGEHPKAADTVGINVQLVRWSAVLAGGVFAGLGGAFFTLCLTGAFNKDITVGNGFIALAALIMGRWKPVLAAVMALFFGFITQMASQLQTINTPIKSQWLLILPYVATIIAVAGLIGRVRPPAADGVPYVK